MSPTLTEHEPAWLAAHRRGAEDLARRGELPARSAEAWRKVDLSALVPGDFLSGPDETRTGVSGGAVERLEVSAAFADERLGSFLQESFQHYESENRATWFTALCDTSRRETVLLARGTANETARIAHEPGSGRRSCPRTFLYLEGGAELTLVEEFRPGSAAADGGAAGTLRLRAAMTDVWLSAGSRLNYVLIGDFAADDVHVNYFRARLQRDSRLAVYLFPLGGLAGKSFYASELSEPGAECRATGCAVGLGREYNDLDLRMDHHASHTQSSILYRTVLRDRAHHVFYGNLYIAPGLKGVASQQTNNNVLLDRRARAESMPNLIVRAEDVSAEHGATVGELDREALYFLMSRGIPETEARALLIEGFVNSILRELPGDELRDEIDARIKERLL